MKAKYFKSLCFSSVLIFQSALHANFNENDRVEKGHVILNDGTYENVSLAWNYAGATDVDYEKVRTDEAYATAQEEKYNGDKSVVQNYLVNSWGDTLATVPTTMDGHYDVFSRTAASNFGKKDYRIIDTKTSGTTLFVADSYWHTFKLLVYKRTQDQNEMVTKLEPLQDITMSRIDDLYKKYLKKTYGDPASEKFDQGYVDAESQLEYTYYVDTALSADLVHPAGVDYAFVVTVSAAVPKGALPWEISEQKFIGVKLLAGGKTELSTLTLGTKVVK